MQKLYRLSAAILIVSLFLLSAPPPAWAVHVIDAAFVGGTLVPVALTNTGEVYVDQSGVGGAWTLIATISGAVGFSSFDFDFTGSLWLISLQGTILSRSLVSPGSIGPPQTLFPSTCSAAPIRSVVFQIVLGFGVIMTVHEDGTICANGTPFPGPGEPVAVEESTWGEVKDKYKD